MTSINGGVPLDSGRFKLMTEHKSGLYLSLVGPILVNQPL